MYGDDLMVGSGGTTSRSTGPIMQMRFSGPQI